MKHLLLIVLMRIRNVVFMLDYRLGGPILSDAEREKMLWYRIPDRFVVCLQNPPGFSSTLVDDQPPYWSVTSEHVGKANVLSGKGRLATNQFGYIQYFESFESAWNHARKLNKTAGYTKP